MHIYPAILPSAIRAYPFPARMSSRTVSSVGYSSVHCVWTLKELGYDVVIVNNNPETVSTDFDVADKLYFEPLTAEDVQNIVEQEKPWGAVVQFGGQTAIKLAKALTDMGVPILGTPADGVDAAEDRERFDEILNQCRIPGPRDRRCSPPGRR